MRDGGKETVSHQPPPCALITTENSTVNGNRTCSCIASLSMRAWLRLLMSSLVHAKWVNSLTCRQGQPAGISGAVEAMVGVLDRQVASPSSRQLAATAALRS